MKPRRATLVRALAVIVLAVVFVSLTASIAFAEDDAATWADYADRVALAREAVDDSVGELLDSREGTDLAARVFTLLPAREVVLLGERQTVVVDNSLLRSMVTDLDTSDTSQERAEAVGDLSAHLTSMQFAVGQQGETVPTDPELLGEILDARQPDNSQAQEYINELAQRFAAWFDSLFGEFGGESATNFIDWVVRGIVLVLALVLLYIAFRVLKRLRRSTKERDTRIAEASGAPVVAAAEGLPDDALAHADGLAAAGQYREAVRALYGGAARSLVEAGEIRQARTLTSGELLAAVGPALPEVRQTLAHLSAVFEAAWYGHRDPGESGFLQARADHVLILSALTRESSGGEAA